MVEYKNPDSIIIDDESDDQRSKRMDEALKFFQRIRKSYQDPVSLGQRVTFAIAAFLFSIWVTIVFWVAFFCACAAVVTLGNNEALNRNLSACIAYFQKVLVIGLGLGLAVFSPALGIGLIYMHSVLRNGVIESGWVDKIVKAR